MGGPDGPEKRTDFWNVTEEGQCPGWDPSLHRVFQCGRGGDAYQLINASPGGGGAL